VGYSVDKDRAERCEVEGILAYERAWRQGRRDAELQDVGVMSLSDPVVRWVKDAMKLLRVAELLTTCPDTVAPCGQR
jgi:hypothetical protein